MSDTKQRRIKGDLCKIERERLIKMHQLMPTSINEIRSYQSYYLVLVYFHSICHTKYYWHKKIYERICCNQFFVFY